MEESSYSLTAAVSAITSFCEIVQRAHADTYNTLTYPPPGGWPEITHELFSKLGKSAAVIELLRHLPYFKHYAAPHLLPDTTGINYMDHNYMSALKNYKPRHRVSVEHDADDNGSEDRESTNDVEQDDRGHGFTPDMIALTQPRPREGYTLILDTRRNAIIFCSDSLSFPFGLDKGDLSPIDEEHDPGAWDGWKCMPTFKIETFFRSCIKRYIDLEWLPELGEVGMGNVYEGDEEEPMRRRKEIMKECGWPGEGWDKVRAEREMTEMSDELL